VSFGSRMHGIEELDFLDKITFKHTTASRRNK
jgi:hypothetical protein